jgi:hypothetical protein
MTKNKRWVLTLFVMVGVLLGFASLSQPSIAMENEDIEYDNALNIIKKRNDGYHILKYENKELKNEINSLNNSIKETDKLVTFILNTGPTARSYLLAVAGRAKEQELNRLFKEAVEGKIISDIIVGGNSNNRRPESHNSHLKLIEMNDPLLRHTKVNEKFSTIEYATLCIPKISKKDLYEAKSIFNISMERQENNNKEECTPIKKVRQEHEEKEIENEEIPQQLIDSNLDKNHHTIETNMPARKNFGDTKNNKVEYIDYFNDGYKYETEESQIVIETFNSESNNDNDEEDNEPYDCDDVESTMTGNYD